MKKKLLSLLLATIMVLSLLPAAALAATTYAVRLRGDRPGATHELIAEEGTEVTINAGTEPGKVLDYWEIAHGPADLVIPSTNPTTFVMPGANLILMAIFVEKSYTITFDGNGGSTPPPITVSAGASILNAISSIDPTLDGGYFGGWSTSATSYRPVANGALASGDMTLYAYWRKSYHITYEIGEDVTGDIPQSGMQFEWEILNLRNINIQREGYQLTAWTDGKEVFQTWSIYRMPSHDTTLYAIWTAGHTLTLDLSGGRKTDQALFWPKEFMPAWGDFSLPLADDSNNTRPMIVRDGYRMIGWDNGNRIILTWRMPNIFGMSAPYYIMPNQDHTLTAVWEKLYNITYEMDGGSFGELTKEVWYSAIEGQAVRLRHAEKAGHTFEGWSLDGGETLLYYNEALYKGDQVRDPKFNGGEFSMPAHDVTLTAVWRLAGTPAYTVNLYVQNINDDEYTLYTKTYHEEAGTEIDLSGWTEPGVSRIDHEGTITSGTVQADGSLVLKLWFDRRVFTVTYNGDGGGPVPEPFTVRYGAELDLPERPEREGHYLRRYPDWYSTLYGLSKFGFKFENMNYSGYRVTADITLYPDWRLITYPVHYVVNGGLPVPDGKGGHGYTIQEQETIRPGYTFLGWYKDSNLTTPWDFDTDVTTQEITLYAKWQANDYNVTFVGGVGGTVTGETTQNVAYGEYANARVEAVPDNAEWNCIGWAYDVTPAGESEEMTGVVDDYTTFSILGDTQFRAVFARRPFAAAVSRGGGFVAVGLTAPTVGREVDSSYTLQGGETSAISKCAPRPKWRLASVTARDLYGHEMPLVLDGSTQTMNAGESGQYTVSVTPERDGTVNMAGLDTSILLIYEFAAPYEVTFDPAPGSIDGAESPVILEYGAGATLITAEIPAAPTSDDYNFIGWYTDPANESTKLDTTNLPVINSDITYYAKWEWKPEEDPSNPKLSGLAITVDNTVVPFAFDPDLYKYDVTLASVTDNMKVKPTAQNPDATFKVYLRSNGKPAQEISGPDANGDYIISHDKFVPDDIYYVDVVVFSEDGTQSVTYTVAFSIGNVLHIVTDKTGDNAPPTTIAAGGLTQAYPLDKTALGRPIVGVDENGAPKTIQTQTDYFVEVQLRADDFPVLAPAVTDQFEAAKAANQVIADYLDFTLHVVVKDKNLNPQGSVLIQPVAGKHITIQAEIPAASRGGSNYQVYRLHDGKVEVLETRYDSARNTVTFDTDKFSPYALAYTPKVVTPPDPGPGPSPTTKYTLTFVSNGGSKVSAEQHSSGTTVKLTHTPIWPGHEFLGWYADLNLTEKITSIKMAENKTVYAKWSPVESSIPNILNGDDHGAYIVGYDDGLVHPTANISRAEVATIFFRLLKDKVRTDNMTETNSFTDVASDAWFNSAVSTMTRLGIVKGRGQGVFDPTANITRAEFAAIAARFDNRPYTGEEQFGDIADSWARAEINRAAANGWVKGDEGGNFRPDAYITRAEAVTLINRVLAREPAATTDLLSGMKTWQDNMDTAAWYYLPIQEATNSHDFDRKSNGSEKWTKLLPNRDWAALEK